MLKEAILDAADSDFSAMRCTQKTLLTHIMPEDVDLSRFEAYDGFVLVYNFWELRALGGGDETLGYKRVKDFIAEEERSVLEMSMDLDRPLEEELANARPDGGDGGKAILTITTRSDPYTLADRTWEVELPEEDGYIFGRR